jgi:predicted RNA binding protein YcfA (HicA-like mRNA interferase family)
MKIPRECNAPQLVRALRSLGYSTVRQSGSHLVLTSLRNANTT